MSHVDLDEGMESRENRCLRSYVLDVYVFGIAAIICGCAPKGTPIIVVGRPEFAPQSPPDSIVETGIRQDPNTGGIFLQWYSLPGAAGFKVYRSDTTSQSGRPVQFVIIANLILTSALNDTMAVDVNSVLTGVRYYYISVQL